VGNIRSDGLNSLTTVDLGVEVLNDVCLVVVPNAQIKPPIASGLAPTLQIWPSDWQTQLEARKRSTA